MKHRGWLWLLALLILLLPLCGCDLLSGAELSTARPEAGVLELPLLEDEPDAAETPAVAEAPDAAEAAGGESPAPALDESGVYSAKEDVALFLHLYGRLPDNFITKREARALGWEGGGLDPYAYGKCIGGDRFGNYEGLLPEESGRSYYECDIDTLHQSSRGAKRIVFSNDGLIYYTGDHYDSFTLLYGEEG